MAKSSRGHLRFAPEIECNVDNRTRIASGTRRRMRLGKAGYSGYSCRESNDRKT